MRLGMGRGVWRSLNIVKVVNKDENSVLLELYNLPYFKTFLYFK